MVDQAKTVSHLFCFHMINILVRRICNVEVCKSTENIDLHTQKNAKIDYLISHTESYPNIYLELM